MSFSLLDHSVYRSTPQRMTASSWTQHVPFAMLLIDLLRPRVVVELGSQTGMSYCAFCQAVQELQLDTRCTAVDSWEGDDQAGNDRAAVLADLRAHHDPRYAAFSTLMQARLDDAVDSFADDSIDLLHINGAHTYEAVKRNVDTWLPKMSARGVLLLHHIADHGETFGVWKLWDELKQTYPNHLEFAHGHGLGVVAIGSETPEGLASVLRLPHEEWTALRDLMRDLGVKLDESSEARRQRQTLQDEVMRLERARAALAEELKIERTQAAQERAQRAEEHARQETTSAAAAQQLAETQRSLENALWQLAWLNTSRGVRMVKLARAAKAMLRQRGPVALTKRALLWIVGKRGYYRLDSVAALPVPKQARSVAREYKQVMFLSGCPGGAMRYRCDHQAEQLNLLGCTAESAAIGTVNLMDLIDRFQCFVLHRVPYDTDVQAFLTEARKHGKAIFFETDDLVFTPENSRHQAELERFSPQDRALYIDEMGRIRQTLQLSDAATVSTEPLRERVAPLCARVAVTPNVVSKEMVMRSEAALSARAAQSADEGEAAITIAYLSGSPSHDRDFLEAQDAVLWALETYPQVTFQLAGPLKLSDAFDRFGARAQRAPVRPWQELPALYARIAINLAPLERDNPFTDAKSSIKFLEAALLKVPTIASPRPDFVRVMRDGVNGLLADSPEAWREALRTLIESPAERRRLGEQAYADVMGSYTTTAQSHTVFDVLREHYRAVKKTDCARALRINWFIDTHDAEPSPQAMLWLADALAARGHHVRVIIGQQVDDALSAALQRQAPTPTIEFVAGHDAAPAADATIATSATTAFFVAQDHESLFKFYLAPDERFAAPEASNAKMERSYALPLRHIGVGVAAAERLSAIAGIEALRLDVGGDDPAQPTTQAIDQLERMLRETCW